MAKHFAKSEFILGGQRSGKSGRAENLACQWLAAAPHHCAVMLATAHAYDDEMRTRIARHKSDRAQRVPGMTTVEEPRHLSIALTQHSQAKTLVVIDCLTLWLTQLMMPPDPREALDEPAVISATQALCQTITQVSGPVVVVGNEIGLGVIPMGREVRQFVDALGRLNQSVASACTRVTFMAAGLPLTLKDSA